MNKTMLMGRLVRTPEVKYTNGETPMAICNFTIAINRRMKKDETDFIPCVAFRKTAETIEKYFSKGDMIGIVGALRVETFKDKEGKNKYSTKVMVEEFHFCGGNKGKDGAEVPEGFVPADEGETAPF